MFHYIFLSSSFSLLVTCFSILIAFSLCCFVVLRALSRCSFSYCIPHLFLLPSLSSYLSLSPCPLLHCVYSCVFLVFLDVWISWLSALQIPRFLDFFIPGLRSLMFFLSSAFVFVNFQDTQWVMIKKSHKACFFKTKFLSMKHLSSLCYLGCGTLCRN